MPLNSKNINYSNDSATDTTDNNIQNNALILCIGDNFYTKKPSFNEKSKTLHIFANRDILLKPKQQLIIETDESFYLSEYLYNFWTISTKFIGVNLTIDADALNERSLNQKLKITLRNYSIFTYRISKDDELGEITFVTEKKKKLSVNK